MDNSFQIRGKDVYNHTNFDSILCRKMLTYTPKIAQNQDAKREYPWLLMLLVFVWLWPGVFSHDLWNPQEPQIYAVIQETHNPFLPTLSGEPYFQAAPIYVWVASWCRYLLAPTLTDAYSAARFATVLFTALGLTAHGIAASRLLGESHGRSAVLILIGSAGLLNMGHFLGTMSVAFAGMGLAVWGLAVAKRQVVWASLLLGIGILFIGQSMGWLISGCLLLMALLLGLSGTWREVRYFAMLLGGIVWATSLMVLQIMVMFKSNPSAWQLYWQHHLFGSFGGLHDFHAAFNGLYYLKNALWFAFPAYPLAAWTAYKLGAKLFHSAWGVLCMMWLLVFSSLLIFNPLSYQDNLIIIMTPLAIMGAAQLDNLRRSAAAFWNWFGIMVFGLVAVFLWLGFVAMNYGFPAKLAERAAYFSPFYTRDIDIMPMVVATLFTPAWLFAITRKRIRGRQAVSNWASGMTFAWALLLTLFLPWLDAAKSYRPIVQQMQNALENHTKQPENCLYIAPEYRAARLAWQEYGKLAIKPQPNQCPYQLIQLKNINEIDHIPEHKIIWQGRRPRQKNELFVLTKP